MLAQPHGHLRQDRERLQAIGLQLMQRRAEEVLADVAEATLAIGERPDSHKPFPHAGDQAQALHHRQSQPDPAAAVVMVGQKDASTLVTDKLLSHVSLQSSAGSQRIRACV